MTTRTGRVVALLLLVWTSPVLAADDAQWRTLRSEAAGFVIDVPGEPSYEYSREWSIAGRIAHHHYEVVHPRATFDIERFELPAIGLLFLTADGVLDRARDDLMARLSSRLDEEERFEVRGHPARRLRFSRPEVHSHSEETRLFLVGRYLYIVSAGPFEASVRGELIDPYYDSFRFCVEELAPCGEEAVSDRE